MALDPKNGMKGLGRATRAAHLGAGVLPASGQHQTASTKLQTCFKSMCWVQVGRHLVVSGITRSNKLAGEGSHQTADSWHTGEAWHQQETLHTGKAWQQQEILHAGAAWQWQQNLHTREDW